MSMSTWLSDPWGVEAQKEREAKAAPVSADAKYIVNKLLLWLVAFPTAMAVIYFLSH